MFKIIIGVIVATVVGLIVFSVVDRVTNTISGDDASSKVAYSSGVSQLYVTISGEVARPSTYYVPLNSTLGDLISAAGGATTNADAGAFDTGFVLENKQSFYIAPIFDNEDVCASTPISKVNINSDDKETLMSVSAFGSAISQAIIDYRTANGPYKRIEEIKNVSGIGTATFEKCKKYIRLTSS
jgi:competence protein ComEA